MESFVPSDPNGKNKGKYGPLFKVKLALFIILASFIMSPFIGLGIVIAPGPSKEMKTVIIPHGMGTREIGNILDRNGLVYSGALFTLASRIIVYSSLQAGEYQFTPGQSMADIILMMHDGRSVVHMFTVAEGLTSSEVVNLLRNTPALSGDIPSIPAEGSLLPETYRYSYGDSRMSLINRMQKAMQEMVNTLWAGRDPDISLKTPAEAVVMASVIEKETGKPAERPRIAGVFYNRLHLGMKLQSDPTVIYAIIQAKGHLDHELNHDDLSFPSPINTYVNDGLPPQPICNPGRASLEAALHPETHEFIYFVADGTGGHVFAHDLATHNQNVAHYRNQKN